MQDAADRLYERILIVRCQTGDEAAFAELVQRYQRQLGYYLRKLLGEAGTADDVLQDVWLDAFKGLPRLKQPAAFSSWLYRIARDRAYRLLRKRRPRHIPLEEADVPAVPDEEEDFSAEDAGRIHQALDELPTEHREVLVLRFLERMSYENMAEVTGCKLGTVRSRLHYAKRALRRAMERTADHE